MKFSSRTTKSALVSALLLGSGVIAMTAAQDDGTQLDPAVPLDVDDDVNGLGSSDNALGSYGPYSNGLESTGGQLGGPPNCGFASDASNPVSCAKDYDDEIMIGVWLCEDDDMGSCGCADFYGCDNAAYYGTYFVNVNEHCAPWDDWAKGGGCGKDNNMACDTLGGWRDFDNGYRTRIDWGHSGEAVYGMQYKGIKFEVHPDDLWKVDPNFVKLGVFNEDYCMGPTPEGKLYNAWDKNPDVSRNSKGDGAPGWWVPNTGHDNVVRSLRPFVDFYDWMAGAQYPSGVGVKMNVWPDRHMSTPFNQIETPNLPDGSSQQAEDQVWCMNNGDEEWSRVWDSSRHFPYVPAGSIQFGLSDAAMCSWDRQTYCDAIDKDNTCLAVRLYYYGDNAPDSSGMGDWDDDRWVAETYINMHHLCDDNDNSFCINMGDGSTDASDPFYNDATDKGVCADAWFTDHNGNPYLGDGAHGPQLWFTNYIVKIMDNCQGG